MPIVVLLLTVEAVLLLLLMFKIPLRGLVVWCMEQAKRGIYTSFVVAMLGVLCFSAAELVKFRRREGLGSTFREEDQTLWEKHLRQVFLVGLSLFLLVVMERVQSYAGDARRLRLDVECLRKQEAALSKEMERKDLEIKNLNAKIVHMEMTVESDVKAMEASARSYGLRPEEFLKKNTGLWGIHHHPYDGCVWR